MIIYKAIEKMIIQYCTSSAALSDMSKTVKWQLEKDYEKICLNKYIIRNGIKLDYSKIHIWPRIHVLNANVDVHILFIFDDRSKMNKIEKMQLTRMINEFPGRGFFHAPDVIHEKLCYTLSLKEALNNVGLNIS
jgi:hypothetical protein